MKPLSWLQLPVNFWNDAGSSWSQNVGILHTGLRHISSICVIDIYLFRVDAFVTEIWVTANAVSMAVIDQTVRGVAVFHSKDHRVVSLKDVLPRPFSWYRVVCTRDIVFMPFVDKHHALYPSIKEPFCELGIICIYVYKIHKITSAVRREWRTLTGYSAFCTGTALIKVFLHSNN